ncbi:hypothetical protein PYW07_017397 [Mythimna separata]|uniref:Uncharacterized protein n=1 Tax=Mythimna separata TaxID=271217 RepID=A0AAD7YXW0_MYTSE|nr:hypothetical protein PYW07_017397 [Mythimna separata]
MKEYILLVTIITQMSQRMKCISESKSIDLFDLTKPTTWRAMSRYYGAIEKHWKIPCNTCGTPHLGTGFHMGYTGSMGSMQPAIVPTEYLLSRLLVVDVSALTEHNPAMVLTLDVALQWPALKHDPIEPTLLFFKFGWKEADSWKINMKTCNCKVPGLSFELAEWIAANLSHVIGVATDTPTFESAQTRESSSTTVSKLLGMSGIYMIENVLYRKNMPEQGCLAITMPLKLLNAGYAPTRLTAFCPNSRSDRSVVLGLTKIDLHEKMPNSRLYDVNLDEILS